MATAHPPIHMICGLCGSNKDFNYEIDDTAICGNDGTIRPGVFIRCDNCSTLTGLDDIIKERKCEA